MNGRTELGSMLWEGKLQGNQSQSLPVVPWCLVLGTSASQEEPDRFQGQGWGQLGPVDCETARLPDSSTVQAC